MIRIQFRDPNVEITSGEFLVPVLRVSNDGTTSADVSTRLNLLEGDLRIECITPDDRTVRLQGLVQLDSLPRTIELEPSESLESGLFLHYTSAGVVFDTTGEYTLSAEYSPSSGSTVSSDPCTVTVREPASETERELASLTASEDLGRTIALNRLDGDDEARTTVVDLADAFPDRREGKIARLALTAMSADAAADVPVERVFERTDPLTVAHWISALVVSGGSTTPLVERFERYLDDQGQTADEARRVVRCEPIPE